MIASNPEASALEVPMTIPELLQIREEIIAAWIEASAAIKGVQRALGRIRGASFRMVDHRKAVDRAYTTDYLKSCWCNEDYPHNIEVQTKALDFSLWVFTLDKMNLTNVMSEGQKSKFLEDVRIGGKRFCEEELEGLVQNAVRIFKDSSMNLVKEVYGKMIGCGYHSGNWMDKKKDNLQKVEKVFRIWYTNLEHGKNYSSRSTTNLDWNDLLTACRLIEGLGPTDYSNNFYSMVNSREHGSNEVQTPYFHLTAYMNGNVKCRWNEDKIHVLERFNAIGSGRENAMPDVMRKRYKGEHFADGGIPKAEDYFKPDPEKDPNPSKDFAFFPTPEAVAIRMVEAAEMEEDRVLSVLEPSAGDGAICGKIGAVDRLVAVEYNHHRAAALRKMFSLQVQEADFLTWTTEERFDRVIMNPPFNDRIEAVHIVHAFRFLNPGGILVAIIPEGWFYRDDLKSRVFREFLTRNEHKPSEKLPKGTFSKTAVETRIVCLRRPL